VIDVRGLTKRYGSTVAVDGLSFQVAPGRVTGFLGPNGAGKSTSMRLIWASTRRTRGRQRSTAPGMGDAAFRCTRSGHLLDAQALHPGRSAFHHLLSLAQSNRIGRRRVDEVLGLVGLADVAGRRAGPFSLGMKQRLGIASIMLGDPQILLFDEPVTDSNRVRPAARDCGAPLTSSSWRTCISAGPPKGTFAGRRARASGPGLPRLGRLINSSLSKR